MEQVSQAELVLLLCGGVAVVAAILAKPLLGLLLVITAVQFEYFAEQRFGETIFLGRAIGVVALLAWACRSLVKKGSRFLARPQFAMGAFGLILVGTVGAALGDAPGQSLAAVGRLGMLVVLATLTADVIESEQDLRIFVWTMALTTVFATAVGMIQYRHITEGIEDVEMLGNVAGHRNLRLAGLAENPNDFALQLLVGIPFLYVLLRSERRWLLKAAVIAMLGVVVFVLVMTASRSGVGGIVVFVALLMAVRICFSLMQTSDWFAVAALAVGFVVAVAAAPESVIERIQMTGTDQDASTQSRMAILLQGVDLFTASPLVGVGLLNSAFYGLGRPAHDTVAAVLGEMGALGTLCFLGLCVGTGIAQWQVLRSLVRSQKPLLRELSMVLPAAFGTALALALVKVIIYQRLFWICIGLTAVMQSLAALRQPRSPQVRTTVSQAVQRPQPPRLGGWRPVVSARRS